mgnify:CR=1 FL=1
MFSYEDYKEIIRIIQSTGNQAGYEEALTQINLSSCAMMWSTAWIVPMHWQRWRAAWYFTIDLLFQLDEQFL